GWSLAGRRDFDGRWRRDPFDREMAIDAAIDDLAGLAQLATAADRPSDPLARLFGRIVAWLDELRRREAVRGRDHDGLEVELRAVLRWQEWRYDGRTASYGSGITRRETIERRDAARARLEAFVQAADADLAPLLFDELFVLVGENEAAKQRAGRLDFLDLLVCARDLLRRDDAVRAEMQRRYTHVFVDEFQDTDPLQVEILLMLCARDDDPERIVPGKLFVVGDPKQAIYRFRRADVTLYETVKARLVADGARLVHLTTSYRSVPALQAAVNAAFEPVMRGDGQARYVALEHAREDVATQPALVALPVPRPYGDSKSRVTQRGIEKSYPEAAAAFVAWLVHGSGWTVTERTSSARVPVAARHVCLMFRRFQSWDEDLTRPYVEALEARGIPHVLVGGRSFHEREEVEAVRNALAAIEWPDDELSVYATLRGPMFALRDDALIAFRHEHGRLDPVRTPLDLLCPEDPVAEALGVLGELHRYRNRRAIADTVARLLGATRAHAGFAMWPAGEQALANVMRMIDLARRFEARGATSFRAFVDKLETDARLGRQPDSPVVEEGVEGVRVMTVHAAKGLEFPVVILCDPTGPLAQKTPSRHIDTARRVWLEPIAGCVPVELREREEEVLRRDREEGTRLAYVAATRARDLLVVPVVGSEERESWASPLVPVVHPHPQARRHPSLAPGCPPFGTDSVVMRG
ncbi:MAG: UvrD-helicase domain-containing protein, partial [Deltaproteobacteria bacterium]|nr:UvrD-helicase domain-containing protein [Deltaproteobacteria bacterium]